ncbi:MAG: hypothetical protein JSS68_16425 [Actinobacteria bacterium]|nr:hypothetical protein [Actinomycetota bacterium]
MFTNRPQSLGAASSSALGRARTATHLDSPLPMGSGPGREWRRYRLAMQKGDFEAALSLANRYQLILELGDALDLTFLAARDRSPIFDPMAVRWIWLLHEQNKRKSKLTLAEHRWLAGNFQAVERGDDRAVRRIEGFLATGRHQ